MKVILAVLLLATAGSAATVVRIACGGPGGIDAAGNVWAADALYTGGYAFTNTDMAALPIPYRALRSSTGVGTTFSYSLTVAPGQYTVTLKFAEPRVGQMAGLRLLNVSINGLAVVTGLDLFAAAGVLKPYDVVIPVTAPAGLIRIVVTSTAGNPLLSAIQIDDVPAVPPTSFCEAGIGNGWPATMGVYDYPGCENLSLVDRSVLRVTCRSDVDGQAFDLLARDSAGVLNSLLVAPMVCGPVRTDGVLVPGAKYLAGELLYFTWRLMESSPANPTNIVSDVVYR